MLQSSIAGHVLIFTMDVLLVGTRVLSATLVLQIILRQGRELLLNALDAINI